MTTSKRITCCQSISDLASTAVDDSLIEHMIVLDYYDGPIGGFLRCPACGKEYHFLTLDWNGEQAIRIIALAEVPANTFEQLACFFGESPNRKKWIPKLLSRASEQDLDRIEPFVAGLAALAAAPSIVLAWNVYTTEIVATRRVAPDVVPSIIPIFERGGSRFDWFAYLGLTRSGEVAPLDPAQPPLLPVTAEALDGGQPLGKP